MQSATLRRATCCVTCKLGSAAALSSPVHWLASTIQKPDAIANTTLRLTIARRASEALAAAVSDSAVPPNNALSAIHATTGTRVPFGDSTVRLFQSKLLVSNGRLLAAMKV